MAFAAAWAWALQAGVIVTGVTPAPLDDLHSGEREMFATAPVAAATPLVTVPAAAVLTAPAARDAAPVWREAVAACHPRLPPPVELAAFLVWAAATPAAPFHAYAASLPPTYTLALTFERADAELLGAPFAVEAAIAAGEAAAGDADAAAAVLARLGLSPPRSTLITALCAVRSRAMHHPGCSAGALLPLGDLFNHAPPRPPQPPDTGGACRACAGWHGASGACPSGGGDNDDPASSLPESWGDGAWDDDARVFRVTARTDYQPGAQVFLSYGSLTNWDAVENYGYVDTQANPCDQAPVAVATVAAALPRAVVTSADLFFHANGSPSWRLLAAARTATAPRGSDKGRVAAGLAASAAGDAAALRGLAAVASAAREALPPRQQAPPGRPAAAVAVAWRREYEAVLERAQAVCGRAAAAAAAVAAGEVRTVADLQRRGR